MRIRLTTLDGSTGSSGYQSAIPMALEGSTESRWRRSLTPMGLESAPSLALLRRERRVGRGRGVSGTPSRCRSPTPMPDAPRSTQSVAPPSPDRARTDSRGALTPSIAAYRSRSSQSRSGVLPDIRLDAHPSRMRRSREVGGEPWPMTASRCVAIREPGRLAETADDARRRHGIRAARVASGRRRPPADLKLDLPHLQRAGEVGRQLGR